MPNRHADHERAFCCSNTAQVFGGIQGGHDIYHPDPFDVPEVHGHARRCFERLMETHRGADAPRLGSVLLLKGRAGSGKTHLMRAFRDGVHREGTGYFGYLQLTTQTDNYHRYVLSALIDHLQYPYHPEADTRTGLQRLSDALAETSKTMRLAFRDTRKKALATLREGEMNSDMIVRVVEMLARRVLQEKRFSDIDIDLVRVLLYLQTHDPVLENRVKKYLRADRLSATDEEALGGIASLSAEEAPARMLAQLGRLMWVTNRQLLVVGVDQVEDIATMDNARERFQRVISTLTSLASNVPSCIVVLACLEDYYINLRGHLLGPSIDRLEQDPEPLTLHTHPGPGEIAPLLARRLSVLYERAGLDPPEPDTYPFAGSDIERLSGLSIRDLLAFARRWRDGCCNADALVPAPFDEPATPKEPVQPPSSVPLPEDALTQAWNDHRFDADIRVPETSLELARILAEGVGYCQEEQETHVKTTCALRETTLHMAGAGHPVLVGVCNRTSAGGALLREIEAFLKRLGAECPVVVRAAGFPLNASKTGRLLAEIRERGGQCLRIEDNEWRAVLAMGSFRERHAGSPGFSQWLTRDKPLSRLPGLRALLEMGGEGASNSRPAQHIAPRDSSAPRSETAKPTNKDGGTGASAVVPAGNGPGSLPQGDGELKPILIGHRLGGVVSQNAGEVFLQPEELTRHTACLGGTGSGKTTLAMRLIEGLLFRGVPVVLLDRKGDLCGYAALATRTTANESPNLVKLRDRIAPALYTPGNPQGRALRLRLLPPGMAELDDHARGQYATLGANSLCVMMGYGNSGAHKARQSLLKAALEVMGGESRADTALDDIAAFLENPDPALLEQVASLPPKTFDGLLQDLNVLRINKSHLFSGDGELLDCGHFFAPRNDGRTPLTIISAKFLGDRADTEFWTAQLFIELGRWIDAAPTARLQGVVFCDEADLYLPAQRQPATKMPMEHLLRRARSAGIGMLLATQSPGDFDYRCRDNIRNWFIGRIRENTAINKMKPLLGQYGDAIERKLPRLEPGQFVRASEVQTTPMMAERCLLPPEQLPAEEILALAKTCRGSR